MKLMIPLDGSVLAEGVLPRAAALARRWDAQVLLVRVCDPGGSVAPDLPQHLREKMLDLSRNAAAEYLAKIRQQYPDLKVQCLSPVGRPRQAIAQCAAEEQCELIVMASHGRKGADRWILGSVAEAVLRRSHCPLLLLRSDESQAQLDPYTRILVPVDGSENSLAVLNHLKPFLEGQTRVELFQTTGLVPEELGLTEDSEALQHCLDQIAIPLREVHLAECSVDVSVVHGEPAQAIVHWAETHPCQLIAMSTLGRTGDRSMWLGSVTKKVARSAPCAVLACPAR